MASPLPIWRVAAVQMDCWLGDRSANFRQMQARLEQAARGGARLVVFPECILTGYCFESLDEARPMAETIPGLSTERMARICKRLGVWAAYGLIEKDQSTNRLFNACALVGPDGQTLSYRKVHLPCLGVDRFLAPGDRPFQVLDLGGLRIGINICYDGSFPEAARSLALLGADLILLPTNWPTKAVSNPRFVVQTRALENHVYYMAVNRVGQERNTPFIGQSRIVAPTGELLAASDDDREVVLYADVDPGWARKKRIVHSAGVYEINRMADRRPEMYDWLTRPAGDLPVNFRGCDDSSESRAEAE